MLRGATAAHGTVQMCHEDPHHLFAPLLIDLLLRYMQSNKTSGSASALSPSPFSRSRSRNGEHGDDDGNTDGGG